MMEEQNIKTGKASLEKTISTAFEQLMDMVTEMLRMAKLPGDNLPSLDTSRLPDWALNILAQFLKTILKPILKLRPDGTMDYRDYGRMIGMIARYKTFVTHDVDRIWKEEGFDKITEAEWEKMKPQLGEELCRQYLAKTLNRPEATGESLETLAIASIEQQFEYLDKLTEMASFQVAQQDPKIAALFHRGFAEGYTCFLDEDGQMCGDRGRTKLYMDLLACHQEIEKYRANNPENSRQDLRIWLINTLKISIPGDNDWFDHFCDEIGLAMKGVGRKRKA